MARNTPQAAAPVACPSRLSTAAALAVSFGGTAAVSLAVQNLAKAQVERFYGEYYFRPRVIWRVVRKAIFNSTERKRLTKEAREYLALRSKRKKFVTEQRQAAGAL